MGIAAFHTVVPLGLLVTAERGCGLGAALRPMVVAENHRQRARPCDCAALIRVIRQLLLPRHRLINALGEVESKCTLEALLQRAHAGSGVDVPESVGHIRRGSLAAQRHKRGSGRGRQRGCLQIGRYGGHAQSSVVHERRPMRSGRHAVVASHLHCGLRCNRDIDRDAPSSHGSRCDHGCRVVLLLWEGHR